MRGVAICDAQLSSRAAHLSSGLAESAAVTAEADVLISPHGSDVLNGFAFHSGASVVEVLPVHRRGCPCRVSAELYLAAERRLCYYSLESSNASNALPLPPQHGRFDHDLHVAWPALARLLEHIVSLRGDLRRYHTLVMRGVEEDPQHMWPSSTIVFPF